MSSLSFSAKSLEMHPQFAGDGFEFFNACLKADTVPLRSSDPEGRVELARLVTCREATLRTTLPAHITTSSVLLSPDCRNVLLLFHKKIGEWVYPGGHADGDWHLLRSALRECFEETHASEVEVLPPLRLQGFLAASACPHLFQRFQIKSVGEEPAHVHFDAVYVFRALSDSETFHDPAESEGSQWIAVHELAVHADREGGVAEGIDSLTAQICLQAMQSALGEDFSKGASQRTPS